MDFKSKWIKPQLDLGDVVPLFSKNFSLKKEIQSATLSITALGVYEAQINGKRIGDFRLAPGFTSFHKRLQYQTYDVTELLTDSNTMNVFVAKGWYRSRLVGWDLSETQAEYQKNPAGLLAEIQIIYTDGTGDVITSDKSWTVAESATRFSEIYDGEVYDATTKDSLSKSSVSTHAVEEFDGPWNTLIPQQGEIITEHEIIHAAHIFTTPAGDTLIDFGQNVTGYVKLSLTASAGNVVDLSFAEILDKDGNFYNENYRSAKCQYHYICREGEQTWHPHFTFYGFRYIRINEFPGGISNINPDCFTAVALYSDIKQTGYINCSNALLNQLFSNCLWGQKDNFVDVPTDCPQRDERLGWTGDAQVFVKTAALNFDVEKFFSKWLGDLAADQHEDGYIGHVIPDLLNAEKASTAWGDAATICPWEIYLAYGNKAILSQQFESMKGWIDYITAHTTTPNLWTGGEHYGDWLGLDAPQGSYKGSSREDFIASAFYAYSTSLVVKAGKILNQDVTYYDILYKNIVSTFQETYTDYQTQTECALAVHFHLAKDCQATAALLADKVTSCGTKLETGFVGTPYLLHALSDYGYSKLAYDLLLRTDYPSWLYPVTKGATTIWEHWDGVMEDGDFWSADMNSYNHYAYGSVCDWIYTKAAGIQALETAPGYKKIRISPLPDSRLDWLTASLETRYGKITSSWKKLENDWCYEISTPVEAEIIIADHTYYVPAGNYVFNSNR